MNKVEKLASQYQLEILPFVAHLETKERNALLKNIEKGKLEAIQEWKEVLTDKGVDADKVVEVYLDYVKETTTLEEEDNKKLKNKNTYFIRKNVEELKVQFEQLVKKEVVVEVVEEEIIQEEVIAVTTNKAVKFLKKNKQKVSTKQKRINKNAKRIKKQRNKKRLSA